MDNQQEQVLDSSREQKHDDVLRLCDNGAPSIEMMFHCFYLFEKRDRKSASREKSACRKEKHLAQSEFEPSVLTHSYSEGFR